MSNSFGIIKAPISLVSDIAKVLGEKSTDLGTLCRSSRINKWSKMKPVEFPYVEPDRTKPVPAYGKTLWWWRGNTTYTILDAGVKIGKYVTTDKVAWITSCGVKFLGFRLRLDVLGAFNPVGNLYDGSEENPLANNFTFSPPTGGLASPYRLADFNYYWTDASYNIIPDYGTESGTGYVNANNPQSNKVRCGVISKAVSNTINSELSFNDMFGEKDAGTGFTVICGILDGNEFTIANVSVSLVSNEEYIKEVELDLNSSIVWGKTVIAIYCAYMVIDNDTYYIPLMQSNNPNFCYNTFIPSFSKRKAYNSWYIDNTIPYYALTFTQKQNYGTGFQFSSVTSMSSFMTDGLMNRWYLKLEMPRKTSSYTFGSNSFMIEFTGEFRDSQGRMNVVYYNVTSSNTRFVLKNSEVTEYDWGTTETVVVTPGSGTQTCYLAMYDLFKDRDGVEVTNGGTIWRVSLFFLNGRSEFSSDADVVYGGISASDRLNINVEAQS